MTPTELKAAGWTPHQGRVGDVPAILWIRGKYTIKVWSTARGEWHVRLNCCGSEQFTDSSWDTTSKELLARAGRDNLLRRNDDRDHWTSRPRYADPPAGTITFAQWALTRINPDLP